MIKGIFLILLAYIKDILELKVDTFVVIFLMKCSQTQL